jgi:hypothetical protein
MQFSRAERDGNGAQDYVLLADGSLVGHVRQPAHRLRNGADYRGVMVVRAHGYGPSLGAPQAEIAIIGATSVEKRPPCGAVV